MTRPLRVHVEGGWYHVFGRGLERRAIFTADRDREHFYELLGQLRERYRILIHAHVCMTNHYHAILQTPDANLSQGLQWFHGSYAAWYNARHNRVGPLFQGRYRAIPVENSAWAYHLSLYVHLNPLRIAALGLDKRGRVLEGKGYRTPSKEEVSERLRRLRQYRWSSYRAYAGYEQAPEFLDVESLLERADRDKTKRHRRYREDDPYCPAVPGTRKHIELEGIMSREWDERGAGDDEEREESPLAPGDTKRYQCWYRDTSGNQPCGVGVNDFNLSNGYGITWTP